MHDKFDRNLFGKSTVFLYLQVGSCLFHNADLLVANLYSEFALYCSSSHYIIMRNMEEEDRHSYSAKGS